MEGQCCDTDSYELRSPRLTRNSLRKDLAFSQELIHRPFALELPVRLHVHGRSTSISATRTITACNPKEAVESQEIVLTMVLPECSCVSIWEESFQLLARIDLTI